MDILSPVIVTAVIVSYLLPTIICAVRGAKHATGIALVNLLLGWTFLGWVGALVWAVSDNTIPQRATRRPTIEQEIGDLIVDRYRRQEPRP